MATLTGRDLWSYVQGMPHLFSVGGLFYEQVKRDLGLIEGKHCQLPSIPGKVIIEPYAVHIRNLPSVDLMLNQHCRWWSIIKPTLDQFTVFVEYKATLD